MDCETSLALTSDYFTHLYGSSHPDNFDEHLILPYEQQLHCVKSALNKPEMRTTMFRPEPSMVHIEFFSCLNKATSLCFFGGFFSSQYHAMVQDAKSLRESVLRRTVDLLTVDRTDLTKGRVRVGDCARHLASLTAWASDFRQKYYAYQDMSAPFLSGVHQVHFFHIS